MFFFISVNHFDWIVPRMNANLEKIMALLTIPSVSYQAKRIFNSCLHLPYFSPDNL